MDEKPRLILPSENGVVNLEVRRMQAQLEPKKPAEPAKAEPFDDRAAKILTRLSEAVHIVGSPGVMCVMWDPRDPDVAKVLLHTCDEKAQLAFVELIAGILNAKMDELRGNTPEGA